MVNLYYYDDSVVTEVQVWASDKIEYLAYKFEGQSTVNKSRFPEFPDREPDNTFRLGNGETIIGVYLWTGYRMDAIQFLTTKRLSPKYGKTDGGDISIHWFMTEDGAKPLNGMEWEKDGNLLRWARFGWHDKRLQEGARYLQYSTKETQGGSEGSWHFNTMEHVPQPDRMEIRKIKIWSGQRVDAIQIVYANPGKEDVWTNEYGHRDITGGSESTFELGAGEYITSIEGKADAGIYSLTFVTNKGTRSSKFGVGTEGQSFLWDASKFENNLPKGTQLCLLGFTGHCWARVDRLTPIWAAVGPVKWSLKIETEPPNPTIAKDKRVTVAIQNGSMENKTNDTDTMKAIISQRKTKTTSLSMTHTTASKFEVGFSVEAGFTLGVGWKVKGEMKWAFESSNSTTIATAETTETAMSSEIDVKVPPQSRVELQVWEWQSTIEDYKWTGKLIAHYANGRTKTFDASGLYNDVTCSDTEASSKQYNLDGKLINEHNVAIPK